MEECVELAFEPSIPDRHIRVQVDAAHVRRGATGYSLACGFNRRMMARTTIRPEGTVDHRKRATPSRTEVDPRIPDWDAGMSWQF